MERQPDSNDTLVARLLPDVNRDPADRAEAWREWYAGTAVAAVHAFVRVANNTPEPDADIVQEAITTAYLQVERGRYRQRTDVPFTAYVKGIARNKIREARRRTWRTVPLEETPPATINSVTRSESCARGDSRSRMERLVERREQLARVREALTQLPEGRREVLTRCLLGQSTHDIAQGLGLSEDAVRQHKSRGLRSIRRYMRNTSVAASDHGT